MLLRNFGKVKVKSHGEKIEGGLVENYMSITEWEFILNSRLSYSFDSLNLYYITKLKLEAMESDICYASYSLTFTIIHIGHLPYP